MHVGKKSKMEIPSMDSLIIWCNTGIHAVFVAMCSNFVHGQKN